MTTYPFLQAIAGILCLIAAVLWFRFFLRRGDPWLREQVGRRFGVTLELTGRGLWRVNGGSGGIRAFLIELLQILFWAPAIMLPVVVFAALSMLFWQGS